MLAGVDGELEAGVDVADDLSEDVPDEAPFPFEEPEELLPSAEEDVCEELDEGLGLEYRSLYHPLPLKETAGAEMTRSSGPLQCGHSVSSGSENFWRFSVWRPHCLHLYS